MSANGVEVVALIERFKQEERANGGLITVQLNDEGKLPKKTQCTVSFKPKVKDGQCVTYAYLRPVEESDVRYNEDKAGIMLLPEQLEKIIIWQ
mmetsp:Transcript_15026/g.26603  ORF Transcript_15026/g.26603 Transcript_15026/m.26603 type:complete len:93 (-) Transcript_15026:63-341(-)